MRVRPATAADVPAMSRIRLAVAENALSDPARITHAMYVDYLERRGRSWVAEEAGAIVGFSAADREGASIWALFVDPAHEGRGAGRLLLRAAVDWLFAQGHAELRLGTQAGTRADRFYAAEGWVRGAMKDACEVGFTLRLSDPRPEDPSDSSR